MMAVLIAVTVPVALLVGWHMTRWERRSRAQWRAYDDRHGDAPRATNASLRARLERDR